MVIGPIDETKYTSGSDFQTRVKDPLRGIDEEYRRGDWGNTRDPGRIKADARLQELKDLVDTQYVLYEGLHDSGILVTEKYNSYPQCR